MSIQYLPDSVASETRTAVASYPAYADAQRAVDHLSDQGFPVRGTTIVGHGVSTVELVTGRMTKGRAALAGAGSGAWLGLMIGLLLSLFLPGVVLLGVMLASTLIGALWGAVLGFVAHWATRGSRDFTSARTLAAERYDVMVDPADADAAVRALTSLR